MGISNEMNHLKAQMQSNQQTISGLMSVDAQMAKEIDDLRKGVRSLAEGGGTATVAAQSKNLGFLPLKDSAPGVLTKIESWKAWKANMIGFLDAQESGMRELLNSATAHKSDLTNPTSQDDWVAGLPTSWLTIIPLIERRSADL